MKTRLLVHVAACFTLLVSSCTELTFPEPQPKGVPALLQVPPSIRGQYLPVIEEARIERIPGAWEETVLVIEPWGYRFQGSDERGWLDRAVLSDTLVIKHYKEYYFVNFKIDSIHWSLRLLKPTPEGSLDFFAVDLGSEEKEIETIAKLSKAIEVKKETEGYDTYYQINPTRDQLMSLISMGFFSENEMIRVRKKK